MNTKVEKTHSVLSPSGADRWTACVGSLAACKDLPQQRSSEPAALGTAKHAISEWILTSGFPHRGTTCVFGDTVTADGFEFTIDEEFCEHVETYVNYVNSRPGRKLFEVWLSSAHVFGVPMGQGGTADCIHLHHAIREIEVIDAKFGYVPVGAKHKQLRIYGACALTLFDLEGEWDTVRCTIVQPQDAVEAVKTHVYTRAEIEEFIKEIAPVAQQAFRLYESPPVDLLRHLTPSPEACAWCPIASTCKARADKIVNMFTDTARTTPDVVLLSDERIAELYRETADIVEWAKAIAAEAESRALRGQSIPGHKLVWGRKGKRTYREGVESDVTGVLSMALGEESMYAPRKLLSPTQVEAALKAANAPALYEQIAPFVTQAEPKLRLVPLSAKGDPVTVSKVEFGVVA